MFSGQLDREKESLKFQLNLKILIFSNFQKTSILIRFFCTVSITNLVRFWFFTQETPHGGHALWRRINTDHVSPMKILTFVSQSEIFDTQIEKDSRLILFLWKTTFDTFFENLINNLDRWAILDLWILHYQHERTWNMQTIVTNIWEQEMPEFRRVQIFTFWKNDKVIHNN